MSKIRVISSLDSSFAIGDAYKTGFRNANDVCISSPWIENAFIDLMRETVPSGAQIDLLVKTPDMYDRTFRTIEALDALKREMDWKVNATCVPYLHAKFTILNDRDVLFGSANATNNGLFYNNEIMVAFYDMPILSNQFLDIFESIKKQRHNHPWEIVRDFHGSSPDKRIVEITHRYLQQHGETRKASLAKILQEQGYSFLNAKVGIQKMLNQGIVYEPRIDFIKLVNKTRSR